MMRKMASAMNPDNEITQDNDAFVIKIISKVFTKESSFTIGEEFEDTQQSGDVFKVSEAGLHGPSCTL